VSDPTDPAASRGAPKPTSDLDQTASRGISDGAAIPDLDPVIHAQARLRVVAALSTLREADRIAFPRLQEILKMTAGNLSVHLRKLEDAGYVEVTKTHRGRTPTTLVQLTRRGWLAFEDYTAALRALLDGTGPDRQEKS
jgi:DNA-binding MarR family transcriptional regulator